MFTLALLSRYHCNKYSLFKLLSEAQSESLVSYKHASFKKRALNVINFLNF